MNQPTYLTVYSCAKTGQGFSTVLSVAGHSPFITEQNLATRFLLDLPFYWCSTICTQLWAKFSMVCCWKMTCHFFLFQRIGWRDNFNRTPLYLMVKTCKNHGFRLRFSPWKPIHFFLFFLSRSPARICDRGEFWFPQSAGWHAWPESRWRFRGFFFDELWILG